MAQCEERNATVPVPGDAAVPADRPGLRVGVFADTRRQPGWLVEAARRIVDAPFAELVIVAAGGTAPAPPRIWSACRRVDRWLSGRVPDPSAPADLAAGLGPRPLSWLPGPRDAPVAHAAWRAGMRALRLDVAVVLGRLDHLKLEELARHGAWRYAFGDECSAEERSAGWREAIEWTPVTHTSLVARLPGGAGERVVYRSSSMTVPYSVTRNRANALAKASCFLQRGLGELHCRGLEWLKGRPPVMIRQAAGVPRAPAALAGVARIALRIAHRALQKATMIDQWALAYRFDAPGWDADLREFERLLPPRTGFWADPFPLVRDGRYYIFFEDYAFAASRGAISMIEVARNGGRSAPVRVLERSYHLSYPFLVQDEGELFMVPESGANRTVELYRCVAFPDQWRLETTLLRDARFLDATLHRDGERWWMFVNVGVPGTDGHDELHLYHAARLTGPWRPHACNPVKSDARSARPAGGLFVQDGALYRPAQVCAPRYGSGVSLNRVLRMTTGEYAEREEHCIVAARAGNALGLHTVNRAGDLALIDVFLRRARLRATGRAGAAPSSTASPGLREVHGAIT